MRDMTKRIAANAVLFNFFPVNKVVFFWSLHCPYGCFYYVQ